MKRILLIFLFGVLSFASFSQALFNRWSPASGTDTYSVNITSYTTLSNSVVYIKFPNTNTGASTLTINTTLGPAALRMWDGNSWEVLTAGQIDINTIYKLSYQGSYFEMESFGSGGAWGTITGTLSDQTDLQAELDDKADLTDLTTRNNLPIEYQVNNYTLVPGDTSRLIVLKDDAATLTIGDFSTGINGSQFVIYNEAGNTVTIDPDGYITKGPLEILDTTYAYIHFSSDTLRISTATESTPGGSGTVTSVGFTGGLISVASPTTTPALTVAGTSGGIPYFSSSSTWASSAALAANYLVIGGGAGVSPSTTTTGTGVLTFLGTPSSSNFRSAITDEIGTGLVVTAPSGSTANQILGKNSGNTDTEWKTTTTGSALTVTNNVSGFITITPGGSSTPLVDAASLTFGYNSALPSANGGTGVDNTTQTYTPTLTNTTNVAASTARQCTYFRVGNVVTVSGQLDIDPTAIGQIVLGISLPVASNFTTAFQLGGTGAATTVTDNAAGIISDATNDRATLSYIAVDTTNHTVAFGFTYQAGL